MYELMIDGRPQPKQRPRVTKSHTYTPQKTKEKENEILASWLAKYGKQQLEGDLEVVCRFFYSDQRTADLDNLQKLVCDSLGSGKGNQPFNDRQIKELHGYIEMSEDERTEIVIRKIER